MLKKFLDTPLHRFVNLHWPRYEQRISSLRIRREDVLVYLVWTLDGLRDPDEQWPEGLWAGVRTVMREYMLNNNLNAYGPDLDLTTDVVCAMALTCMAWLMADGRVDPMRYQQATDALNDRRDEVLRYRRDMTAMECPDGLDAWLADFWRSPRFSTVREVVEWDREEQEAFHAAMQGTPSVLEWMNADWSLEHRQKILAEIRDRMEAASEGLKPNSKKKGKIMLDIFQPLRMKGHICRMPTYEEALQLFGKFACLPTQKPYYAAVKKIMGKD